MTMVDGRHYPTVDAIKNSTRKCFKYDVFLFFWAKSARFLTPT